MGRPTTYERTPWQAQLWSSPQDALGNWSDTANGLRRRNAQGDSVAFDCRPPARAARGDTYPPHGLRPTRDSERLRLNATAKQEGRHLVLPTPTGARPTCAVCGCSMRAGKRGTLSAMQCEEKAPSQWERGERLCAEAEAAAPENRYQHHTRARAEATNPKELSNPESTSAGKKQAAAKAAARAKAAAAAGRQLDKKNRDRQEEFRAKLSKNNLAAAAAGRHIVEEEGAGLPSPAMQRVPSEVCAGGLQPFRAGGVRRRARTTTDQEMDLGHHRPSQGEQKAAGGTRQGQSQGGQGGPERPRPYGDGCDTTARGHANHHYHRQGASEACDEKRCKLQRRTPTVTWGDCWPTPRPHTTRRSSRSGRRTKAEATQAHYHVNCRATGRRLRQQVSLATRTRAAKRPKPWRASSGPLQMAAARASPNTETVCGCGQRHHRRSPGFRLHRQREGRGVLACCFCFEVVMLRLLGSLHELLVCVSA